jgi:hypothetical protein
MKLNRIPTDINENPVPRNVSAIKMSLDVDSLRIGVLVESHKDGVLYQKLLHQKCRYFPQSGKYNLLKAMEMLNEKLLKRIIGIIDADFRRISSQEREFENLFITDKHDAELMMLFSPAWENVLNTFIKVDKLEDSELDYKVSILDFLLKTALPISCLRWLREKNKLNDLQFRTQNKKDSEITYMKYASFIEEKTLALDKKALLKEVENKSNKAFFFKNNHHYEAEWEAYMTQEWDLGEFSNGHDILHILSIGLQKLWSNLASATKVSADELGSHLLTAYRIEDFKQTNLYAELAEWEVKIKPFHLLRA